MNRLTLNTFKLVILLLLSSQLLSQQVLASQTDYDLHIHVHYQQKTDSWKVIYKLPIAVEHLAFSRRSNFDRTKLYQIDESKFKWDNASNVLVIRSIDNRKFKTLELTFSSFYDFIQKDYTHNLKYSDGSVLLYTNHLALGANIIEDKSVSPIGQSFSGTQFHFYGPNQNIVFLGRTFKEKASFRLEGEGTYIYFGNIIPIASDNMIAIVDPALPTWAWKNTQEYFPKLFEFYEQKTNQPLDFKPMVFFNYDQMDGDYSNYAGGTLAGLVQLTINGSRWKTENKQLYNTLFHFLAHEAAHFWNGQMFSFEDQAHSWMHEGGADAFANFAMREFGLIDSQQLIEKFEEAANSCVLDKGEEPLEQSAKLRKYRNYYTCGATMELASHHAINKVDPNLSTFDLWKRIFNANTEDRIYNQQDYFKELKQLTGSNVLSSALETFSTVKNLDNKAAVASWFEKTNLNVMLSHDYPQSIAKHWGRQVIKNLMQMHCGGVSFSSYNDYLKTYPIEGCGAFEVGMEIQFLDGLDILHEGIDAYNLFTKKCASNGTVSLQNREKEKILDLECTRNVPILEPYMRFEIKQ